MNQKLEGIVLLDGTKEDFTTNGLETNKIYFIRTSPNGDSGYIFVNGKKYGTQEDEIDCGEY